MTELPNDSYLMSDRFRDHRQDNNYKVDSNFIQSKHTQEPQTLIVKQPVLSVLESRELRRKVIMDEDLDEVEYEFGRKQVRESQGDLTLEMLSGAMPKRAIQGNQRSPQHPGDSYLSAVLSDIPKSNQLESESQRFNQNQIKTMDARQHIPQYGLDDEFSVEAFRKNNAQLQDILMQLQTPQFEDVSEATRRFAQQQQIGQPLQQSSSTSKFNNFQANSQNSHKGLDRHPRDQEVSQFQYRETGRHEENVYRTQGFDDQGSQQDYSKIQMLQSAIAQKAQFQGQPRSQEGGNYRKTFQPQSKPEGSNMYPQAQQRVGHEYSHNPAFQNAAQTMLDYKENYNQRNYEVNFAPKMTLETDSSYQGGRSSSQLRQASEFTLQPRPEQMEPQQPGKKAPDNHLSNVYVQTMKHFDDIPISKIQKMTGYQTHPIDYETDKDKSAIPTNQAADENEDASFLPLGERVLHNNWRIRLEAYKEINQLFYSDYAKYENAGSSEPDLMASFDIYGPLLQEMIQDTNLVGAYEALVCLHSYTKFATSIKAVSFATHNQILEKLQTNKPNFKEISTKILLTMLRRDQASFIFPELIKRFRSKNSRTALFTLHVVNEAFKTNTAIEEVNLKTVFRGIQDCFNNNTLPIRELSYQILQHIYRHCGEEASRLIGFCRNLRAVQVKELTEQLQNLSKNQKYTKNMLFDAQMEDEFRQAPKDIEKKEEVKAEVELKVVKEKTLTSQETEQVDLLTLLPENFQEIPYLTKINAKKEIMEQFNTELHKLTQRRNFHVKNKDYTMLFNISVHMLEDKNMLVYLEAIRNIELLSQLLGQQIKQVKVKQFISLIANKYGELKTAVVAAVDKGLLAIVKHSFTPVLFAQECINQIAQTHKNPKVKQMVIEHALEQLLASLGRDQSSVVASMFKHTKEKMLVTIQKDTNANVRDACVGLLTSYKAILPDDTSVQEAINQLPKYRVQEILKKMTVINPTEDEGEDSIPTKQEPSEDLPVNDRPQFSRSMSNKLANMKKPTPAMPEPSKVSFAQLVLRGTHQLPAHMDKSVRSILDTFGKMAENDFGVRADFLEALWNENLLQLGEAGLPEARPILIKGAYTLIMTPNLAFAEHSNHFRSLLAFTKRLFVLQRSIERQADGRSEELTQYLRISLIQNQWLQQNQKETCQMLTVAMHATNNVFELNERLREVVDEPLVLLSSAALQIIEAVYVWLGTNLNMFMARGLQVEDLEELRGFGIKYLEGANFTEIQRQALVSIMIKFKDLVAFQRAEIERMRQVHRVQEATISKISELDESAASMQRMPSGHGTPAGHVNNQEMVQQRMPSRAGSQGGPTQNTQSSGRALPSTADFRNNGPEEEEHGEAQHEGSQHSENEDREDEQEERADHEETKDSPADSICLMIDAQFEKGLLMFKELVQNDPEVSFEAKEQIFDKLLSIVSQGVHANQQQQYKQAYALKALMWMREEAIGLQECFELAHKVMSVFSASDLGGHDSTVELYLLNFWTKELSLRDICDRVGYCVLQLNAAHRSNYSNFTAKMGQEVDSRQIDLFNCLLGWLAKTRLFPDKQTGEAWEITDLRKIVMPLCQAVLDQKSTLYQVPRNFVVQTAAAVGREKLREFMEIQLVQKPDLFQRFSNWFDSQQSRAGSSESKRAMPKVAIEKVTSSQSDANSDKLSHQSSQSQLKQANNTPRGLVDSHLQSYKERRDQHKAMIAGGQESLAKEAPHSKQYEDIISKIEQNLANVKQVAPQVAPREHPHSWETEEDTAPNAYKGLINAQKIDERQRSSEEESRSEDEVEPLKKTNTSAYYQQHDKAKRYHQVVDSPRSDYDNAEPAHVEDLKDNLEMSELKSRHWRDKIRMLEEEKRRIESQSEVLQREKDTQSDKWREKMSRMESEHKKVIRNLSEMNDQYTTQLTENEKLRSQLNTMQQQHAAMMSRFEEIEKRINAPPSPKAKVQATPDRKLAAMVSPRKDLMVSIRKLERIKETFGKVDDLVNTSQEFFVIQKIQDLLLSVEKNVDGELAQPLICHYQKLKAVQERMAMITAVREALDENEDVLLALSVDVYKAMLNFLLRAFSFEKQVLERMSMDHQGSDQNEITMESQRIVSKLLNSKEFTISLVCLFQLLREAMPENLALQLTVEQRQYLRVIMRCIQRITKALHSEQPDLIRAFDVLVEMQKMFVKHPPEQLREDLPCLADFDFVYRGMKDVSDKMIELQPEKVQSFLGFSADQPQNAFIKYLRSVTRH